MSYMARHVSHGVKDASWKGTTYCVETTKLLESLQTTADDWNAHLQSVVDASRGAWLEDVLRALRLTGSMRRSRTRCKSVVEFVISTLCFTAADKDLTLMHGDRKSYALQRAARIPYLQVNLFWASVSVDLCHGRPRGFEVLPHDHDTRYTKTW